MFPLTIWEMLYWGYMYRDHIIGSSYVVKCQNYQVGIVCSIETICGTVGSRHLA